jgi:hydroxymethylpyrimidine/phosphomethylpyrimidine kinase
MIIVMQRRSLPIALTIAGSDSGGGAGLQADLHTFARLGVHGTTVVTCLTAQNPRGVRGVQATTPAMVRLQLDAVFAELRPAAIKTGMLYSSGIIDVVAEFLGTRGGRRPSLIVDPVMVATSGAALLQAAAVRTLKTKLLPLATLLTPNVDEATILTGARIEQPESLRQAARQIHETFGCAVLAKGGHLRQGREAIDIFYDGRNELLLTAPMVRGISTHGTGCTYSAAIAAGCARGWPLVEAVIRAKQFISDAIAQSVRVARHDVLHWPARTG